MLARDAGAEDRPGDDGAARLLVLAREFTRGGAAYLALRHARRLAPRYAIDLLVTGPCDEGLLAEFPAGGVVDRTCSAPPVWDDALSLPRLLHRFALDHSHLPTFRREYRAVLATSIFLDMAACAAAATVRAARRLVFLVDEGLALYPAIPGPARRLVDRAILGADAVLPVSARLWGRMADPCPALRARPRTVLPPPLDTAEVLGRADEPQGVIARSGVPAVLTVARLSADKQVARCLRVHHRLKAEGLRFRWYVVGAGPEEPALREEIGRLGMQDEFLLLGRQENVYSLMKACDVFALLSSSEGCPTVVREALRIGCPVVMTDVNGADELIDRGRTGLVVADDADAIAEGLARVLRDGRLRDRFRENLARADVGAGDGGEAGILEGLIEATTPDGPPPRVSVLIPTYNQERFIDRAIAGALEQDHPSLEVVVADDASTDGTGRVALAWSFDRRLRYVRNARNLGRVANYRRAVTELARGEWVLMLDGDDDLADPGFLRRACEAIDRHADRPVVFAQAGHRVRYLDGARGDVDILPPIDGAERVLPGGDYLRFVFETGFFTHLGALYRRDRALGIGFYTADISSSDMDSLLRLALEGDVLLLNTIAGHWVQHGGNASSRLPPRDLAANVLLFRRVARRAVRRGLTSWGRLEPHLTRYEARTLVHLFGTMVGDSARGPLAFARLVGVALRANLGLLREPAFLAGCRRFARALLRPSLERSRAGRVALKALRGLRSARGRLPARGSLGVHQP